MTQQFFKASYAQDHFFKKRKAFNKGMSVPKFRSLSFELHQGGEIQMNLQGNMGNHLERLQHSDLILRMKIFFS